MFTVEKLYQNLNMCDWSDISLELYKEFTVDHLLPKKFRYYLEGNMIVDVVFKEWAMKHLWAIQHIDSRIHKNDLFNQIDGGLSFETFMKNKKTKKDLMDQKDRIRMFSCIYMIMKTGKLFYVEDGVLEGKKVKIDYIKSSIIDQKGVNVGLRFEDDVYVPITILIDRAIHPNKTIEKLRKIQVMKLEIIENNSIIETITY